MKSELMQVILLTVVLAAVEAFPVMSGRKVTIVDPKSKTQVVMNNLLEGKENMEVRCQNGNKDLGTQQVPNGEHCMIEFWPGLDADYDCTFLFNEIRHKFDIYLTLRDAGRCGVSRVCTWNIKENGPCFHDPNLGEDQCYPWNQ